MRISDWSSDVCSSDLSHSLRADGLRPPGVCCGRAGSPRGALRQTKAWRRFPAARRRSGRGRSSREGCHGEREEASQVRAARCRRAGCDRKRVGEGKGGIDRVELGGSGIIKKKKKIKHK